MIAKQHTSSIFLLAILGLLLLAGCNLPTSDNGKDEDLRQTEVALGILQTSIAQSAEGGSQATAAAQKATIEAVSAAQTAAAAGGASGPDLAATQTTIAAQQTGAAASAIPPTPDMAATQVAIAVQQTSIAAGGAVGTGGGTPTTLALPGFSNFTDNFNDPTSGWPVQTSGPNQWYYANDHFYISVGSLETRAVVTPGYILSNGVVMAEAALTQEQPHAYYGVVCRLQDINNYYFFDVAHNGYYSIGKMWNGQRSLIVNPSAVSAAINGYPGASNLIAGHCRGNELSLFVNDILVATGYDNTFTSGQIGLSASAGGFPGVIAAFDWILAEE